MEDPGAAARLFKDFASDNEKFEVKALSVSGKLLGADQIDVLAKLPTREQAGDTDERDEGTYREAGTHNERGSRQAGPRYGGSSRSETSRRPNRSDLTLQLFNGD